MIPWSGIAGLILIGAVPPTVLGIAADWIVLWAALLVETSGVAEANRWFALLIYAIFSWNKITCSCVIVAVTRLLMFLTTFIGRDTEVTTPAIGTLDIAFRTFRWRAYISCRVAEWTVLSVANLLVI